MAAPTRPRRPQAALSGSTLARESGARNMTVMQGVGVAKPSTLGCVLVVEDDSDLRKIVVRHLSRWGFTIIEAADGGEGVEQFRRAEKDLDVILLDIMLPVLDGVGVARAIQEGRPDLPIVAYSAAFNDEVVARLEALGVAHFLSKPFRADDLRAILDRAMNRPD